MHGVQVYINGTSSRGSFENYVSPCSACCHHPVNLSAGRQHSVDVSIGCLPVRYHCCMLLLDAGTQTENECGAAQLRQLEAKVSLSDPLCMHSQI